MRVGITSVDDAKEELDEQSPFEAVLVKELPGPGPAPYWLATLPQPVRWFRGGVETSVTHLILAARWQGTRIGSGMQSLPVGIAYVIDESVLTDASLDLRKCEYVAIGAADEVAA